MCNEMSRTKLLRIGRFLGSNWEARLVNAYFEDNGVTEYQDLSGYYNLRNTFKCFAACFAFPISGAYEKMAAVDCEVHMTATKQTKSCCTVYSCLTIKMPPY